MINDFLARLDNDPAAPADWVWPTFNAKVPTEAERVWRDALLGAGLPREHKFLRALTFDTVVRASPLASERTSRDPRLSYRGADVAARTGAYGYTVIATGPSNNTLLSLTLGRGAAPFLSSVLTPLSSSSLGVQTAGSPMQFVSVTFSSGLSNTFPITPDALISGRFTGGPLVLGQSWTVSYWAPGQQIVVAAIQGMGSIGTPTWLPPDLLAAWAAARRDTDKLACVLAGFARP